MGHAEIVSVDDHEPRVARIAESFGQSFLLCLNAGGAEQHDGGRILVCRDTRPSGPMIRAAVLAGLLAAGCEVIDLGICPTPSMQLGVKWLKADGGIAITAGHNPGQWNALKFVRGDGLYLNSTQGEELLDIFHQGEFAKATWDTIKQVVQTVDPIEEHIKVLRESFAVEAIRVQRLTVAVDCC